MTSRLVAALAAVLLAAGAASALIDSNLGAAPYGGGCYPTGLAPGLLDMLTLINPEWAPVVGGTMVDSTPVLVHGLVTHMHGDTSGDFPSTHLRADVNYDALPDPGDEQYVATGNDDAQLHIEWEAGAYPAWAWASVGDRIVVLGRQIFDCGHPGGDPGHCSASTGVACANDLDCRPDVCPACAPTETCVGATYEYGSEIHPPYASAAIREGRGGIPSSRKGTPAVPVTRADVFVSANGGGAGDRCVVTHRASDGDQLGVECWPLAQPIAPLNGRDFRFSVPLPPRPPGGRLRWRWTTYDAPGGVAARYHVFRRLNDRVQPHLDVTIGLAHKVDGRGTLPTGFAGTLEAGWVNDPTPLTHVRVTIDALVVDNALQPVQPSVPRTCNRHGAIACSTAADCPTGDDCLGAGPVKSWRGQVSVDGRWQELVGLDHVDTGAVVPQQLVFDDWLRADQAVVVHADARSHECIDTMYGKSLATGLTELGFSKGVRCLATTARNPGDVDASHPGPDFGAGPTGTASVERTSVGGDGGHCAAAPATPCTVDADCGAGQTCVVTGGAMRLRYTIRRLPD